MFAILLISLLAGCAGTLPSPGQDPAGDHGQQATPDGSPTSSATPATPGDGNATPSAKNHAPWPSLDAATVRPGTQVAVGPSAAANGTCTSNFLFRDADNATLYLGLAAHCVRDLPLGAPLPILGAQHPGRVAYSSWEAQNLTAEDCSGEAGQQQETPVGCWNDFALVEIDAKDRQNVHPAVRHYGGPVGLKDAALLRSGDRVVSYGNSQQRQGVEQLNWREGIVAGDQEGAVKAGNEWRFNVVTVTGSTFGDSGSGVMTKGGQAVGVVVTTFAPMSGQADAVNLTRALAFLNEQPGWQVRLVTWPLLDAGLPAATLGAQGPLKPGMTLPTLHLAAASVVLRIPRPPSRARTGWRSSGPQPVRRAAGHRGPVGGIG